MKIYNTTLKNLDKASILIKKGGIVAFPTETVYGLGALASDSKSINRIYKIKKRPKTNPLIVHIHNIDLLSSIVECVPDFAYELMKNFWPGPLTLIFPYKNSGSVDTIARASLNTVAVRLPNNPIALKFLEKVNLPVVAPSANISQQLSPTKAIHVLNDLGSRLDPLRDMILDGGNCNLGIESTVIDLTSERPNILRLGGLSSFKINKTLKINININKKQKGKYKSPGMMKKHYAPKTEMRLNANKPLAGEVWLGFGAEKTNVKVKKENLSLKGNIEEAAVNLYSMLRKLDNYKAKKIAVAKIPNDGMGEAINDRLKKGATK